MTALFPAVSNIVGSETADMSIDFVYDAQFQLNVSRVPLPYNGVLRPKAWNELSQSIRGEEGAFQFKPAAAEALQARGPGFKGEINGIRFWDSDSVSADGGGTFYRNAIFGQDAFEYMEAPVDDRGPRMANVGVLLDAGILLIVADYDVDNAIESLVSNYYPSAVETEDARAVLVKSQVA